MNIRKTFIEAAKNRNLLIAGIVLGVLLLAILVVAAFNIRPNELQVPLRYSAFGITNIYREQWYYEFAFVGFAIVAAVCAYAIALKMFATKSAKFATYFLWLASIVMAIILVMIVAIFRVISVVQ